MSSLGDYNWGINTGGRLSTLDTINLSLKAISIKLKKAIFGNAIKPISIDPRDIKLPDSKLVREVLEYIGDVHQNSIKNHCLRSYILGVIFGQQEDIKYDQELFALSALLHDIGLEERYCCLHKNIDCFAIEGAIEAGNYLKSLNYVSDHKINEVKDAIALHLNITIPDAKKEAYLLNKASGTDTIGFYSDQLTDTVRRDINNLHPRLGFNEDVHKLLLKQCSIRPKSRIQFLYKHGFGDLLQQGLF